MLGKTVGRKRRGQQRMGWLDGMTLSKLQDIVMDRETWCAAVHEPQSDTTEWLNNHK